MTLCSSCGQEHPAGVSACDRCGATLAEGREERKVVTVLALELDGSTEDAARLVERYGGSISASGGRRLVAVFGAPLVHEDDPERAVRAALALRDAAGDEGRAFRAGVDTGEALVALTPLAADPAVGEVVDRASRLLAATSPGDVTVGVWTFERTRQAIDYRDAAPVDGPAGRELRAWRATSPRARVGLDVVHRARAPLAGRGRELGLLRSALARARQTRTPELVTLVGPAGIGKTRLVVELMAEVDADKELISWRQGRSLPFGGVAFWALGEVVRAQAGILETDDAAEAATKLQAAVEALLPDPDARTRVLERLRPLAGLGGPELQGDQRGEAFAAWRQFLEALARERPLVLVFEDLHWADDGLLDFVDHLVAWTEPVPLLVVCTARPELIVRHPDWGSARENASLVALEPLTDAEIGELLDELLLEPAAANVRAEIVLRAGGNPLYAEQYASMLDERGSAAAGLVLPATVQDLVAARLDSLPLELKALLQDAAVIGKVFWTGALGTLAGSDRRTGERLLAELERRELVQQARRSAIAGEAEYAFRHLPVQEVAYAQIAERERAEKHRLVARWLHSLGRPEGQAELLAHHYVSALELVRACGGDDRPLVAPAREALRDAGDRALALNAFAAAASAYARALELWPRGDDELPRLRLRHGQALHCVGDEHAVDVLERAHRELTDAGERDAAAEADAVLAEALWLRGQRDRAFAHLGRARQVVRHAAATPLKTRVLAVHGRFQTLAGDNETGRSSAAEALALADELGLAELQAHALNTIGLAKSNVGEDGWLDDLERSVAIAKAADAREAIRAVNNLASLVSNEGDLGRAHELWRETRTLAERFGDRQFVRFVDGTLVWVDYVVGNWTAAMRAAFEFVAECEAGSPHYQESGVRATRALIRHMRGDAEGALEDTAIGLSLAREVKDPQVLLGELGARARICGELGRDDEARELMDEALAAAQDLLAARQGAAGELIWVADRLGRRREVRELLAAPPPSRWNQAALAVVDGDFPRAADCYAEIGAHTFAACARLRAAIRLFEEERRSAAETELRPALEFFRTVGATRYIAQAETLLAALV